MRQMITTLFILMSAVTFTASGVYAAKSCQRVFEQTVFDRAFEDREDVDNFELLAELENIYNRREFSRPVEAVGVSAIKLKRSELQINMVGTEAQNAEIKSLVETATGEKIWYQHPFNTAPSVPYFYTQGKEAMRVAMSASRSLFFMFKQRAYSIRMPTNRARGPKEKEDLAKTNIAEELSAAEKRMTQVNLVEKLFGLTKDILLAKEVAIVKKDKASGYMIRLLEFLENKDRYYMPAFSLGEVGQKISKKMGKDFEAVWLKSYAENLGKVKAQLLIHYGLIMDFPHGQNILLEFDKNFNPTGRFVLRDLDDMSQYKPVVSALNEVLKEQGETPIKMEYESATFINLLWSRMSSRALSKSSDEKVSSLDYENKWNEAHTKAFIKELGNLLGVRPKDLGTTEAEATIALGGTWGAQLIKNYFSQKLKK